MADKFENFDLYTSMKEGLEDALAYVKGDKSRGRSSVRSIPDPVYSPEKIAQLRLTLNMTQLGMANIMGVSKRTVEAWETGRSHPKGPANRMLYLIEQDHSIVKRLME